MRTKSYPIIDCYRFNEEGVLIYVSDSGRGQWKIQSELNYGWELTGFDGENSLVILVVGRQDGKYHITVAHTQVDGDTKVAQELAEGTEIEFVRCLNLLIRDVFNEKPKAPKKMTLKEALEVVWEQANDNMLDPDDPDFQEGALREQVLIQQRAFGIFNRFISMMEDE